MTTIIKLIDGTEHKFELSGTKWIINFEDDWVICEGDYEAKGKKIRFFKHNISSLTEIED